MSSEADNLCARLPGDADNRMRLSADNGDSLSLSELAREAAALASAIRIAGGTRVALLARNGIAWIVADIACQIAAVPLLPVPGFFSPTQSAHALHEAGVDLLLCDHHARHDQQRLLAELDGHLQPGSGCCGLRVLRLATNSPDGNESLPLGTGKITYTSGSTGAPKGVCLSNARLLRQAAALAQIVGVERPRHLSLLPLSVLLENVAGAYAALLAGGEVLLPDLARIGIRGSSSVAAPALLSALDELQPQTLILIPQLLKMLVHACGRGWRPPSSLRFVAVGGAHVAASQILRAREYGIPAYEGYGLSECVSVVTLNTPHADRPGSAGRALPHLDVVTRDGELMISGNPFLGYVGKRASWHPRTIASGDLGYLDDEGFLHLQGRRSNVLISSYGRNISPEWVESELAADAVIDQCIVFGEARPFLVALVWADASATDAMIASRIETTNAMLPDYARVQRWLRLETPLTHADGLLTVNGKPQRTAIAEIFEAQIARLYGESTELCRT
ncbi:MAG: AMP-binding protein [Pseudomonadales bacterium]|nr:AMP-binding protein [Pseudomonadales bacterium]MCP5319581.1 AMP-binding protein [Pseudomonadales bacterium]MCP5337490.1 AMP-binding protein [Pseudomonadales bacterium]